MRRMTVLLLVLPACLAEEKPAREEGPTYWADVRPILDRSCARCHHDGGFATSFDDAATAQAFAAAMATRTAAGEMPPPAPDPECAPYEGSDVLFLGDDDKATIAAWAEAGAPLGDEADAPAEGWKATELDVDLALYGAAPYQPVFDETGNDYRCFVLDPEQDGKVYVTGFQPLVDNARIVHHVVVWLVDVTEDFDEGADGRPGFDCPGFGEGDWEFFSGWAPGGHPVTLPPGMGLALAARHKLVLQMHYYEAFEGAEAETDQSGYGLVTTDSVDTEVYQMPLGVYDFTVPADTSDHTETMIVPWQDSWGDVVVIGSSPHMHVLGSGFDFKVHKADGTEQCVVEMDDWNFHNQVTVMLDEPVRIAGGDTVEVTCHWDNSAGNPAQTSDPPQDVYWGEGTNEEMCFAFTLGYED
ncbi:MAG: hypothetical protein ACOZNI_19235 [Myxococcota bacterium]